MCSLSVGGADMANFASNGCGNAECTGPPDPVYGDEKYRRIRVASQVCVDLDSCLLVICMLNWPFCDFKLPGSIGVPKRWIIVTLER